VSYLEVEIDRTHLRRRCESAWIRLHSIARSVEVRNSAASLGENNQSSCLIRVRTIASTLSCAFDTDHFSPAR
jgi:hypothetical protein